MNNHFRLATLPILIFVAASLFVAQPALAVNLTPLSCIPPNCPIGQNGAFILYSVPENTPYIFGTVEVTNDGPAMVPLVYSMDVTTGYVSGDGSDEVTSAGFFPITCPQQPFVLVPLQTCTNGLFLTLPDEVDYDDHGISAVTVTVTAVAEPPFVIFPPQLITVSTFDVQVNDAPEPSSLALFTTSTLAMVLGLRRRIAERIQRATRT